MRLPKPLYIILIGTLIGVIGSGLPTHSFFVIDTLIKINLVSITGAVIAAIGVFMQHKSSSEKSDKILFSTLTNIKTIQQLTEQNSELQQKLSESIIVSNGFATGGDSYAEIELIISDNKITRWVFQHRGKYPLYNVTARVEDLDLKNRLKAEHAGNWGLDEELLTTFNIPFEILHIGLVKVTSGGTIVDLYGKIRSFKVFTMSKNGNVTQLIKLFNLNGKWLFATKIFRENTGEQLLLKIEDGFPMEMLNWEE